MKMQIPGTGCAKCKQLTANAEMAATEMGLAYELENVTDIGEIGGFGVMTTPAGRETAVSGGSLMAPLLYGIGTGVAVLTFAGVLGFGSQALSGTVQRITGLWARRVTGVVFVAVGMYYSLHYIFEVFS